jgi:hypothetical protein
MLRRIVFDVLIPLEYPDDVLAKTLCRLEGVDVVDILVTAIERRVETTVITIEGKDLDLKKIREVLNKSGSSIQNIDRITAGKRLI